MNTLKVISRIEINDGFNTAILFIPESPANVGCIACYAHAGQHSEASLDYYHKDTRPPRTDAEKAACDSLVREYESLPGGGTLRVMKRLSYKDLNWV